MPSTKHTRNGNDAVRVADVRRTNRRLILDALRAGGRQMLKEVASATGLTGQGARDILADLVTEGRVLELRVVAGGPRRGRPPVWYEVNPVSASGVVVRLGRRMMSVVVVDAVGRECATVEAPTVHGSPQETIAEALVVAERAMTDADLPQGRDAALCLVVEGDVDPDARVVHESASVQWSDVDVVAAIGGHWSGPITCIDSAKASTIAEMGQATDDEQGNVVVLDVSNWLAAGVVLDGRLHTGAGGLAGQVGHCRTSVDGEAVDVHSIVSGREIVRRASEDGDGDLSWFADVLAAADSGDSRVQQALVMAGRTVVEAAIWLIAAYGPDRFVFGGAASDLPPPLAGRLLADLDADLTPRQRRNTEIEISRLGYRAALVGGAELALDLAHDALDDDLTRAAS